MRDSSPHLPTIIFTVKNRLQKAMNDKHASIHQCFPYFWFTTIKETKAEDVHLSENSELTAIINQLEKYNGFAYAKPLMFEFYEYLAQSFYSITIIYNTLLVL
jgi:hypothetical protein